MHALSIVKAVVAAIAVSSTTASPISNVSVQSNHCSPSRPVTGPEIRSIFNEFVDQFYFKRDFAGAVAEYVAPNLIQHNPNIANGSQAELAAVTQTLANYDGPNFELAIVDEERGYGVVFNRFIGKPGTGLPFAGVTDIYRFEGSCMVEHWDVIESLPPNSTNPVPF